jgi:hypothetical protein
MARPAAPARGFAYGDIGNAPAIDIGASSDDAFRIDRIGVKTADDATLMVFLPSDCC